uniref:Uncharacterized protein n=1 Tax=Arundo donax TaxID=35708 RepID=A0A0A9CNN6_ARUDO
MMTIVRGWYLVDFSRAYTFSFHECFWFLGVQLVWKAQRQIFDFLRNFGVKSFFHGGWWI